MSVRGKNTMVSQDNKIGKHEPILITLTNGMKLKGVVVITGFEEHDKVTTGIEYTIPNMHFNIENGKLVKHLKGGVGTIYHGTMASRSLVVEDPLITMEDDNEHQFETS
jgi:hypothetical protein